MTDATTLNRLPLPSGLSGGHPKPPRRRPLAIADAAHVVLAAGLMLALVVQTVGSPPQAIAPISFGLVLGFFAADVTSGVVHWFCDTYGSPSTPLLGRMVIASFREHHLDPGAIARHGWLERNGNSCLAALPLLALAGWPASDLSDGWTALAKGFFAGLAITLAVTNQIHAWAHVTNPPRWVRWLQRRGLLIAPARHEAHHGGSHRRAYAVVSGWSNRWLDGTLSYVERILAGLGIPANASERAS